MRISDFSIKRPVLTIVTMLFVIILGVVSLLKIPVTLIPELNPPIGVVVTNYPGASPVEVNEKVTKPLEASLSTLPGLKNIQSTSQEGSNLIVLEFDWSTKIKDVQADVVQRIDLTPLPDDVQKPNFLKFDPSQFPIIQLSLRAESGDVDVRTLAESLEKELRRTDGVANVNVSGKLIEEIQIELDEQKLVEKGLTQADVVQVVQASNISLPGEPIATGDGQLLTTRIISTLTSPEEIADLIISVNPIDGQALTVGDVATVARGEQESATETTANNQPAVLMSVLQESGANTANVSDAFQDTLTKLLEKDQYEGVKADILFDQGDYVKLAISNIASSLIFGGILAMAVLFFFLRGIRSPLIIGISIPYSVIVTFVLMFFSDFSLNIMTLGALAIGIGMLVDNAVVVIENIERHLDMGKAPTEAAKDGTKEVILAITASTLTTVVVFVPVIFVEGLIGQVFTEFALTISFSLFASLVVAITVVPMMASRILVAKKENTSELRLQTLRYRRFAKSVEWAMHHRVAVLIVSVILFGISLFSLTKIGTEFLPATDEGNMSIDIELDEGVTVAETKKVVREVEGLLKKSELVDVYVSLVGGNQQAISRGQTDANEAQISVKLIPLEKRNTSIFEFVDTLQQDAKEKIGDRAKIEYSVSSSTGSSGNELSFRVTDSDEKRLFEAVQAIQQALPSIGSVTEVTNDLENTVNEIQIKVDREKAKDLGFVPAQVAQTVNNMTRGMFTTQLIAEDGEVLSVFTSFGQAYRENVEALKQMQLRSAAGLFVELKDIANVSIKEGPVSIRRSDQAQAVAFFVSYSSDESLGGISKKVDEKIATLKLPEETQIVFGGDRELFDNARDDMYLAVVLAIVLVYFVMAAQFESFKYPFVIMFSVPLMVIGVAIAMWLTDALFGVTSVIGVLILVGIVVNNGIVLVDFINQKKAEGMASYDAIVLSVQHRLRPILMTALTNILGLVPTALGLGEGTEINQPMGIVVIGGMLTATLLTFYVVPIIYSLFDKETRSLKNMAP